ncbi:MAG: putative epoxidase [Ilumatobacteraceae bacterium]|nr:putative epoxidase [Ilumatobacteraceae bacterium]
MHITVVGGGVSGLSSALTLARQGHRITVLERDDTPMPDSPDAAFAWDRRGAPQVRHSHAFLARLRNTLRDQYPDVLHDLLQAGATEIRFGDDLPPTLTDFVREPADDDLSMLACRRTTFEWVLRRSALAEGLVTFVTGVAVVGVTAEHDGPRPRVTGVRLCDGSTIDADLVVTAVGRRGVVPEWLAAIGAADVTEEVEDTGIVYFSRFYRLRPGCVAPARSGVIGGDLGYLKYGVFAGDNGTFSITLATPTDDERLRKLLADPAVFEHAARQLTVAAEWLDGRAEPLTADVHVMAGLLNRWRDYVVDGEPVVTGLIPVGDAILCTNPLYGRGCSTAFWGAQLLADAISSKPDDLRGIALVYDDAVRSEILPWYRATVEQDAEARRVAAAMLAGDDPDGDTSDPRTFMRGVFRDGLLPAIRTDATVMRAFVRSFNLLTAPDALAKDADIGARVLAVWNDRDSRPPEPLLGPKLRSEMLDLLAA